MLSNLLRDASWNILHRDLSNPSIVSQVIIRIRASSVGAMTGYRASIICHPCHPFWVRVRFILFDRRQVRDIKRRTPSGPQSFVLPYPQPTHCVHDFLASCLVPGEASPSPLPSTPPTPELNKTRPLLRISKMTEEM